MSVAARPEDSYFLDDDILFAKECDRGRNGGGAPPSEAVKRLVGRGRFRYAKAILDHYPDAESQARYADLEWKVGHSAGAMQRCLDQAAREPGDFEALDRLAGMAFLMSDMRTARDAVVRAVDRGMRHRDHVTKLGIEAAWITGGFDEGERLIPFIRDEGLRASLARSLKQMRDAAESLDPQFLDAGFEGSLEICRTLIAASDVAQATAIVRARILFGGSHREIMALGRLMHDLGPPNWNYYFWAKCVAVERFPQDPEAILGRAGMLVKRGDVNEGARLLATVAGREGPQAPETAYLLAFSKAAGAAVDDPVLTAAIAAARGHKQPTTLLAEQWLGERDPAAATGLHSEVADELDGVRRFMPVSRARKPRLAVCISGQLRSFFATWEITAKTLAPWDPVVFLSTWDNIGVGLGAHDTIDRMLPHAILQALSYDTRNRSKFEQLFPTLFHSMTMPRRADEAGLRAFSGIENVRVHSEQAFDAEHAAAEGLKSRGNLNQPKMFAMLTDGNDQKNRYEREHGMVFDAVLRMRPDRALVVLSPDDIARVCERRVVLSDYFLPGGVGDQVMLSSSAASNAVASIWPRMRDAGKPAFFEGATGRLNEFMIAEYLMANRIDIGLFEGSNLNQITAPTLSVAEIWDDAATDFLDASDDPERRRTFAAMQEACQRTAGFAPPAEKAAAVAARLGG